MNTKLTALAASLLVSLSVQMLSAQTTPESVDKTWTPRITGGPSLLITPDARSAALGQTSLLSTGDAFAVVNNMSALAYVDVGWGASFAFTPWMPDLTKDMNLSMVSGYYSLAGESGMIHALAAGVRYFNIGTTLAFTQSTHSVVETHPYELAIDLGYAVRLHPYFSMGLALRYFVSDYTFSKNGVSSRAQTILGDLSATYRRPVELMGRQTTWTAAIALRNLGGKLSHDGGQSYLFSPTTLDLGMSVRLDLDEADALTLFLQGEKLMVPQLPTQGSDLEEARQDYYGMSMWKALSRSWTEVDAWRDLTYAVGLEYIYQGRVFGRVGYRYEHPDAGTGAGLTLGGGFRYRMVELDLAYFVAQDSKSPLNNTLRVTLGVDF